jgi:hypothetical protein
MYESFILHWAFVTVEKKSTEKALFASKTVISLISDNWFVDAKSVR